MKPWYKSKTLMVNALVAGLIALESTTGLIQPYLPADLYVMVAIGLPVINAMLRVITTSELNA